MTTRRSRQPSGTVTSRLYQAQFSRASRRYSGRLATSQTLLDGAGHGPNADVSAQCHQPFRDTTSRVAVRSVQSFAAGSGSTAASAWAAASA